MANIRIKDQTTDTALVAGDYVIVDNETEGTRKFDLGQKLVDIDDDITDVKADLNDITVKEITSINKYNPSTIEYNTVVGSSGQSQSQTGVFTSDYIECEPSDVIRFYRITSSDTFQSNNMMYVGQYTADKTFISRTTYMASGTTLANNCCYVRISQPSDPQLNDKLRAVTFNKTLTSSTIDEYKEEAFLKGQDEIDFVQSHHKYLSTINRLDINKIARDKVIGSDGELSNQSQVFTSEFISCNPSSVIRFYRLLANGSVQSNTIMYLGQYTKSKRFISRTTYAAGNGDLTLDANCYYVRLSLGDSLLSDQVLCLTFDKEINRATISPAYSGNGIANIANVPTKLKVMTYNIGRYSYGVSPYYINSDYDTKVLNYKKFFSSQKCDVVGIEENNIFLDALSSGSHPTNELYSYLYPYFADEGNGVSLKSKHPMYNQGIGAFVSSSRSYVYGTINVNGKEIFLMTVHLTPNPGESQDTLREQEVEEILGIVSTKEYFIIFGDFNAQTTDFYDLFLNAGCHIANGGYLPFEWTYSYTSEDYSADIPSENIRYFDNIVTSKNIVIDFSERVNVYSELSSDHIPFVAHLTIN